MKLKGFQGPIIDRLLTTPLTNVTWVNVNLHRPVQTFIFVFCAIKLFPAPLYACVLFCYIEEGSTRAKGVKADFWATVPVLTLLLTFLSAQKCYSENLKSWGHGLLCIGVQRCISALTNLGPVHNIIFSSCQCDYQTKTQCCAKTVSWLVDIFRPKQFQRPHAPVGFWVVFLSVLHLCPCLC